MTYTVNTHVIAVVQNEVDEEEMEELVEESDYDTPEEYAESLADTVKVRLLRTFGGADDVPILDVTPMIDEIEVPE